jgi:hypothetical protein
MTEPSSIPPEPHIATAQTRWFYANEQNEPVGPLSFEQLKRLAEVGVISSNTYVLEHGKTEWFTFAQIDQGERGPQKALDRPSPSIKTPPRWLVVLLLILFFPVGIALLWVSDFKKFTKVLVSSAFGAIIILGLLSKILFPNDSSYPSNHGASSTRQLSPGLPSPSEKTVEPEGNSLSTFPISREESKRSFNGEVDKRGAVFEKFRIRDLLFHSGDEGIDTFTVKFGEMTLIGSVRDSRVRDLLIATHADTGIGVTTERMITVPPLCVSALDPSTDSDFGIAKLINQAFDHHDAKQTGFFGAVRVDVLLDSKRELMLFAMSPKGSPSEHPQGAMPSIAASSTTSYQQTLEYQLALVNSGKGVLPIDEPAIGRFRYLLRSAAAKTGNDQKTIADLACKGQGVLREDGKKISVLEFMEAVEAHIPDEPRISYQDASIVTITFLEKR